MQFNFLNKQSQKSLIENYGNSIDEWKQRVRTQPISYQAENMELSNAHIDDIANLSKNIAETKSKPLRGRRPSKVVFPRNSHLPLSFTKPYFNPSSQSRQNLLL